MQFFRYSYFAQVRALCPRATKFDNPRLNYVCMLTQLRCQDDIPVKNSSFIFDFFLDVPNFRYLKFRH
uniref:Uncharacterized protein n=1 Tax=Strigamia maritima TaxID=126957 RepID=T1ISM4_STRMM